MTKNNFSKKYFSTPTEKVCSVSAMRGNTVVISCAKD